MNGSPSVYTTEATSNRLTSITNPAQSFGYDNAGNTTSDSANYTATYGMRGQLATITKGGVTGSYTYDAFQRRVRKVTSAGASSTVIFVYDLDGQLLGEYDQTGKAIREYVWLDSTPVAMFMPDPALADPASGPPLVFYIHADHINAPRLVVDRNNAVRWRWFAEPFGTTAPEVNPRGLGAFTLNLRFPGQYADAESGLWYNYFRQYDPSRGYTQSDPIGLAGGSLSTYSYVDGNPLSLIDPNGLNPGLGCALGALAGPIGCGVGAAVGTAVLGGAAVLAIMSSPGDSAQAGSAPTTVAEFCSQCKATATRSSARAAAYVWAGITSQSTPVQWSSFNPPGGSAFKRNPVWADFFRNNNAAHFGAAGPLGHVEEHPFGHPDIPGGLNHDCPHFVATNSQGVTIEFPYRPGSP